MKEQVAVQGQKGFTLIELLVVIAFAVLVGVLLPAVQRVQDAVTGMAGDAKLATLMENLNSFANGANGTYGALIQGIEKRTFNLGTPAADADNLPYIEAFYCDLHKGNNQATALKTQVVKLIQGDNNTTKEVMLLTEAEVALAQFIDGVTRLENMVPVSMQPTAEYCASRPY